MNPKNQFQETKHDQLITDREVAELLGIGRSTVWKFAQEGVIPAPLRFGQRCSRWHKGSVLEAVCGGDAA